MRLFILFAQMKHFDALNTKQEAPAYRDVLFKKTLNLTLNLDIDLNFACLIYIQKSFQIYIQHLAIYYIIIYIWFTMVYGSQP